MHTYFVWRLYWEWDLFFLFIIRKHDLDLYSLHTSKSRGTGSLRDAAKCQGTAPRRLERESSTGNEQITDLRTLTGSKFLWSRFFISYKQYSEDTWKIKKSRVESCINSSLFSLKPLCDAKVRIYMIIFSPCCQESKYDFQLEGFQNNKTLCKWIVLICWPFFITGDP